jgi:hypothetical protein
LHSGRIILLRNRFHIAFRLTSSEKRKEDGEK